MSLPAIYAALFGGSTVEGAAAACVVKAGLKFLAFI